MWGVGVVDTPTDIGVGVGQYDDVLPSDTFQQVGQRKDLRGGQVAVGVEGVEMGPHGRGAPLATAGYAHTAICRGALHCYKVKIFFVRIKGFVGEKCIHRSLRIGTEGGHLLCRVTLGHDDHIYGLLGRAATVNVGVGRGGGANLAANEYVGRVESVGVQGELLHLGVGQAERDVGLGQR